VESSPSPFFERACTEIRTVLCDVELRSFSAIGQHDSEWSKSLSWRITTPLSWGEYTEHVVERLSPRMDIRDRSEKTLVLRETLPGDVMTLELTLTVNGEGPTDIRAEFQGATW